MSNTNHKQSPIIFIASSIVAAISIGILYSVLGPLTLSAVVFVVAMIVVSLRAVPVLNNILCYFLELITFFAAHIEPTLDSFVHLSSTIALGSIAGWVSMKLQQRLSIVA